MTQNQIDYFKAKETERHNLAMEEEAHRSNLMNESLQGRSIDEAVRHNKVTENNEWYYKSSSIQLGYDQLRATERMNEATAAHYERQDAINAQHYTNQDKIAAGNMYESIRHNQANEAIAREQTAISWKNAASQALSARSAYLQSQASLRNAETQSRLADNTIWTNEKKMMLEYEKYNQYLDLDTKKTDAQIRNLDSQTTLNASNFWYTQTKEESERYNRDILKLEKDYLKSTMSDRTKEQAAKTKVTQTNADFAKLEKYSNVANTWADTANKIFQARKNFLDPGIQIFKTIFGGD